MEGWESSFLFISSNILAPGNRGFNLPNIHLEVYKFIQKGGVNLDNHKKEQAASLMAEGLTQTEVAKKLKVSKMTISNWKKEPEFMESYKAALWERLGNAVPDAINTLVNLSKNAKNENIRYAASKDLVDRLGFKPDESIKVNMEPVVIVNDLKE